MKTIQSGGERLGKEKTRKENRVPGNKHSRSLTYLSTLYTNSVRKIFFFLNQAQKDSTTCFKAENKKLADL